MLGHVIAFEPHNEGTISEIRDGDTPSVIAALIVSHIDRNLVPYAEEVRSLAARYRRAKDLENYRNMMPEVLALDELAKTAGRPILPEELSAFFNRATNW